MTRTAMPDTLPPLMTCSPDTNRFFWNTLHRKQALERFRTYAPKELAEPQDDG